MFGKNEIVGKKFFEEAGGQLFVTSLFYTLQGEGPYRGEPAIFVRLAKCNLACSFCDTFFDGGDWYSVPQLNNKIADCINDFFKKNDVQSTVPRTGSTPTWALNHEWEQIPHKREMGLVLTGGEPMLQENIVPFLKAMNMQFKWTQIESNGLLYQPIPDETTLVCSPKCLEEDGKAIRYLSVNKRVMERADCLKFVMEADPTSPYSFIPEWVYHWRDKYKRPVFISPMNIYNDLPQKAKKLRAEKDQKDITIEERSTTDEVISFWEPGLLNMEQNQKNHEYTAKYCIRNGFTFNVQIHLLASLA